MIYHIQMADAMTNITYILHEEPCNFDREKFPHNYCYINYPLENEVDFYLIVPSIRKYFNTVRIKADTGEESTNNLDKMLELLKAETENTAFVCTGTEVCPKENCPKENHIHTRQVDAKKGGWVYATPKMTFMTEKIENMKKDTAINKIVVHLKSNTSCCIWIFNKVNPAFRSYRKKKIKKYLQSLNKSAQKRRKSKSKSKSKSKKRSAKPRRR